MCAKNHVAAVLILMGQTGVGLAGMMAIGWWLPGVAHKHLWIPAAMVIATALSSSRLPRGYRDLYRATLNLPRRLLGGILLGSSLAAVLWKSLVIGNASWLVVTGLCVRWYLFGTESIRLRREDRRKMERPSAATQTRRGITLITGLLIPIILLAGAPPLPWLWLSFLLTLFCQWTIAAECCHAMTMESGADLQPLTGIP